MTWADLLVIVVVLLFAIAATRRGFISVLLSLAGFIVSLIVAFGFYQVVAAWLSTTFGWSSVWTKPVAFVALWGLVQFLVWLLEYAILSRLIYGARTSPANRLLAVVPGALQGLIISAVLLTMLALIPLGGTARRDILRSPLGGRLVEATLALERPLEGIFGPAAREALGFMTINPAGGSTQTGEAEGARQLQFTVDNATPSPSDEQGMLDLVNKERTSRGLVPLEMDETLQQLARAHADDMFKRGYFAHETPEGVDPFQRMREAGVVFGLAGENLALAPTLEIAHDGLMNSPGHRANILNPGFRKVGIGVLDGGIYGKMFVQEFTD